MGIAPKRAARVGARSGQRDSPAACGRAGSAARLLRILKQEYRRSDRSVSEWQRLADDHARMRDSFYDEGRSRDAEEKNRDVPDERNSAAEPQGRPLAERCGPRLRSEPSVHRALKAGLVRPLPEDLYEDALACGCTASAPSGVTGRDAQPDFLWVRNNLKKYGQATNPR